ncbi:hypothetical protein L1987_78363 [Smallanthus sonchifolius]|uniref:Uncharacterized protein n=1 Tax=Smallanthus sonchifolius TaxID=185202 RepID=A0ACB8ZCP4_9ASTR|nr:hypothetical protein L1987_78363 [Smallanthus sonchifolius]
MLCGGPERCYAVVQNKLLEKLADLGVFTIPCLFGSSTLHNALADLSASINLMPYSLYEKLGLGDSAPTRMSISLADRSVKYPRGIVENLLVKVDKFVFPLDFFILYMEVEDRVSIILGRPFLRTAKALIDVFDDTFISHMDRCLDYVCGADLLNTLHLGEEDQEVETDALPEQEIELPSHLEYAFLDGEVGLPVIISAAPTEEEKEVLKLLNAGLIYAISDSTWVSPTQVVPKKGGMTVVKNDKDELIPTRTVTGRRVCIDYR